MELKEFMDRNGVSKDDVIMAGWLANEICKSFDCDFCPYHIHEASGAGICANSAKKTDKDSVEKMVKERVQKLLHSNRMGEVAEMLGVKFGEPFKIAYIGEDISSGYFHLEKTGLYCDESLRAPFNLTDLLVGDAYIVKEENKDE